MGSKLGYWLRWIAVFPGAVISGFLATFPLHWLLYLMLGRKGSTLLGFIEFADGINTEAVEYLLSPLVIAFTYINIGYKLAPKYKFKTTTILFVIYLVLWFITVYMTFSRGGISNFQLTFSGRTILALLGSSAGLLVVWRKSQDEKTLDNRGEVDDNQ